VCFFPAKQEPDCVFKELNKTVMLATRAAAESCTGGRAIDFCTDERDQLSALRPKPATTVSVNVENVICILFNYSTYPTILPRQINYDFWS
jgi:hypothetical protein